MGPRATTSPRAARRDRHAILIDDADGDALHLASAGGEALDALGRVVVEPLQPLGGEEGGGLGHAIRLGKDRAEDVAGGEDAIGGHGGSAEEQRPQRGEVVIPDLGVVDDEVDHRGHEDGGGHLTLLDDRQESVGGEAGDEGVRTAGGGHGVAGPGVGQVEHGGGVEPDVRLLEGERHLDVLGVGDDVALREHDALGQTGGPARVAEVDHVVLAPGAGGGGEGFVPADERFVGVHPLGRALGQHDDVFELRQPFAERLQQLQVLRADEQGAELAVVDDELQLGAGEADVQGSEGRARVVRGEVGLEVAVGVAGEDADVLPRLNAEREDARRQGADACRCLGVGAPQVALNDGGSVAVEEGAPLEDVADEPLTHF